MAKQKKKEVMAEFGNLICRFGEKGVLVDHLESVVLPAFLDKRQVRSYDETSYFFFKPKVVDLGVQNGERIAGIAGRLIKDTQLIREQVYDREHGLVKDSKSLKSSPSSFFLLVLNNHRLIFVRETVDAPTMATFRSTLYAFLKSKYREEIDAQVVRAKAVPHRNMRVTKKSLMDEFPPPSLDLVPLTSNEAITEFIERFSVLKSVQIIAKERNHELDNKKFFAKMQEMQDEVGSSKTTLTHSNSSGLDPGAAIEQINDATSQGNQLVKLAGLDTEGDKLLGNNETFQLRRPLLELGLNVAASAKRLYSNFSALVAAGAIKVPKTPTRAKEAVKRILGEDE